MLRVARFLGSYLRDPAPGVGQEEVSLRIGEVDGPALLFRPRRAGRHPGWVMLHGITVPGMRHPALLRFARAVAGAGGAVLVPEVDAWKQLRIDPGQAHLAIDASARYLAARDDVSPGGVGVIGFSFGATQALITAAHPGAGGRIRSVVGFGGYCDLGRTLRFMLTGEHEWRGARHRLEPDPYGRWIVAANYVTDLPGYSGAEGLAAAARELAAEAGRRFVYAGDPQYDPLKAALRTRLQPDELRVWDLIAPPAGAHPDPDAAAELADALMAAALRRHPELDPVPVLPRLHGRVVLAHGRDDHLVPFTETLRLASHLPPAADASVTITRLFAHSGGAASLGWAEYPAEVGRYFRLLDRALR